MNIVALCQLSFMSISLFIKRKSRFQLQGALSSIDLHLIIIPGVLNWKSYFRCLRLLFKSGYTSVLTLNVLLKYFLAAETVD